MDFRDLFRGFLGLNHRRNDDYNNYSSPPRHPPAAEDPWDTRDPNESTSTHRFFEQPPEFVVTDMINIIEEMFSDMEHSVRDMDSLLRSPSMSGGFGTIIDIDDGTRLPALPPPPKDDANLRSLVLKENDKGRTKVPVQNVPVLKKDEDLDDLVGSSSFSLENLPRAPVVDNDNSCDRCEDSRVVPRNQWSIGPGGWGSGSGSSFESVISTYSFSNGKWEGKSVRESNEGKETTSYTRDENGEMVTTTEFTPYSESSSLDYPSSSSMNSYNHSQTPHHTLPILGVFKLFGSLFKPGP